jgi:hypothetical protein
MPSGAPPDDRCPVCGVGRLRDVAFDAGPDEQQGSGSREVQTFTCGHEVIGERLDSADADHLEVERRGSEDTVTPPEA